MLVCVRVYLWAALCVARMDAHVCVCTRVRVCFLGHTKGGVSKRKRNPRIPRNNQPQNQGQCGAPATPQGNGRAGSASGGPEAVSRGAQCPNLKNGRTGTALLGPSGSMGGCETGLFFTSGGCLGVRGACPKQALPPPASRGGRFWTRCLVFPFEHGHFRAPAPSAPGECYSTVHPKIRPPPPSIHLLRTRGRGLLSQGKKFGQARNSGWLARLQWT